jgi:hypothetical protein
MGSLEEETIVIWYG